MRSTKAKQLLMLLSIAAVTVSLAIGQVAGQDADEEIKLVPSQNPTQLVDAPGKEQLEANCLACHTAQPILTHAGFTPEVWDAEVQKMRNLYGAEVSDEDAAWIVAYLMDNYSDPPLSPENVLLNGINTTRFQEPVLAVAEQTPETEATPEPEEPIATPEASPPGF